MKQKAKAIKQHKNSLVLFNIYLSKIVTVCCWCHALFDSYLVEYNSPHFRPLHRQPSDGAGCIALHTCRQLYTITTTPAHSTHTNSHSVLHPMFNRTAKNLLVVKHVRQFIIIIFLFFTLSYAMHTNTRKKYTHRATIQRLSFWSVGSDIAQKKKIYEIVCVCVCALYPCCAPKTAMKSSKDTNTKPTKQNRLITFIVSLQIYHLYYEYRDRQ